MPPLRVTCAIIRHNGRLLIAQRRADQHPPLQWEFPGGKVEAGESEEDCLVREIEEELGIRIQPIRRLPASFHDYGDKQVELIPFECRWISGEAQARDHARIKWVPREELRTFDWCAADVPIIDYLLDPSDRL